MSKRPTVTVPMSRSASVPALKPNVDPMYPPEGINQLPLRARVALTPLQLTSYLGSRQPPVPPPSVPIEHEKIDFISTFNLRSPLELPPPNVRKLGGSPSAKYLRQVTAYRSDVHATLPPSPQLQQHTVKPKPALTRLEVQHQAVEQILAQQRAISPIREHIERRHRAEAAASKAVEDFQKAIAGPPSVPPITTPLPEPTPLPAPAGTKSAKLASTKRQPMGASVSVSLLPQTRHSSKVQSSESAPQLHTVDHTQADDTAGLASLRISTESSVDNRTTDDDTKSVDATNTKPLHIRMNSRAMLHVQHQLAVEAPLWYEPTPETDGTPLLTAPTPLSPSYARRKSVVLQDPDTASKQGESPALSRLPSTPLAFRPPSRTASPGLVSPISVVMAPHTPSELRPLTGDPTRPPPAPAYSAEQIAQFPTPVQRRNIAVSAQIAAYRRADTISFDHTPKEHTTQRYFGIFEGQEGPKTLAVQAGKNPELPVYKDQYMNHLIKTKPQYWCIGLDDAKKLEATRAETFPLSAPARRAKTPDASFGRAQPQSSSQTRPATSQAQQKSKFNFNPKDSTHYHHADCVSDDESHMPPFMRSKSVKGHTRHPGCRDVVSAYAPPQVYEEERPAAPDVPVTPFNFLETMRLPDRCKSPIPTPVVAKSTPLSPIAHARVLEPPPPPAGNEIVAAAATRIQRLVRRFLARKQLVDHVKTRNPIGRERGEARLRSAEKAEREHRATQDRIQSPLKWEYGDFCSFPRSIDNTLKSPSELAESKLLQDKLNERRRQAALAASPPRSPLVAPPPFKMSASMMARPHPAPKSLQPRTPQSAPAVSRNSPKARSAVASPVTSPLSRSASHEWFTTHASEATPSTVEQIVANRPSLGPLLLSDEAREAHAAHLAMARRVHDYWENENDKLRRRREAGETAPRSPSPSKKPWVPT